MLQRQPQTTVCYFLIASVRFSPNQSLSTTVSVGRKTRATSGGYEYFAVFGKSPRKDVLDSRENRSFLPRWNLVSIIAESVLIFSTASPGYFG